MEGKEGSGWKGVDGREWMEGEWTAEERVGNVDGLCVGVSSNATKVTRFFDSTLCTKPVADFPETEGPILLPHTSKKKKKEEKEGSLCCVGFDELVVWGLLVFALGPVFLGCVTLEDLDSNRRVSKTICSCWDHHGVASNPSGNVNRALTAQRPPGNH